MSFTYTDFANGQLDSSACAHGRAELLSDPIVLALVDTTLYVADRDGDFVLDDIPGGGVIATATPTGLTVVNRVFTFNPVTFAALTGAIVNAALLYKDTGDPTTSPLIAYLDDYISGVPWTPDGTDWVWNPDAAGVLQL